MSTPQLDTTVSSIISSRLQYIKFKQQNLFESNAPAERDKPSLQITDDVSAAYAHELIMEFENYSRANRLLTLMWNDLRKNNANTKVVFELLLNNKYLGYSPEDLSGILNPQPHQVSLQR